MPTRDTLASDADDEDVAYEDDDFSSCRTHCCAVHGCKYGEEGCPVSARRVTQEYPCEECARAIDETGTFSKRGEVGYELIVCLRRDPNDGLPPMTDLPTEEEVRAAIGSAIAHLTIKGWNLTRFL